MVYKKCAKTGGAWALPSRRRSGMKTTKLASVVAVLAALFFTGTAFAQTDPGVRSNTGVNAGQPLASVTASPNDLAFFQTGFAQFNEDQTVTGDNPGLGPRFNLDSCGACHSQPAPGGTSPASGIFPNVGPNPQSQVIANGIVNGSTNTIPYFVFANGPVREARFPFFFDQFGNPNLNAPNGGVEDLFTVSGRTDAGSCSLQQPSFNAARMTNNIIFRIPTPTFGTGLMANIDDSTLLANHAAQANNRLGISGAFNHNGNDGTTASTVTSDAGLFNTFMQFLDQPTPSTASPGGAASIANGRQLFRAIGCALCHTPSFTTQASHLTPGLSNAAANLFSDIEIHHMGIGLADNVSQGGAGGDQFRTSPLWGLGQRIFFLHDGRTSNLLSAIEAHQSSGSEATQVEENFDLLSPSQQQDLLNFLRSL